jgi:patatin-like phospholipase/acyl hydrolase
VAVFKTDHHQDYRRDWKSEAWQVARATSAAPTFFRAHESGHAFFLDGGLWANNPVLCAVIEALTAYDLSPSQIRVLSIGTGTAAEKLSEARIRAGYIGWWDIIKTAMFLTSDSHHGLASLLVGASSIIRLYPDVTEIPKIELNDWQAAISHLPNQAMLVRNKARGKIDPFFMSKVRARERFYSS